MNGEEVEKPVLQILASKRMTGGEKEPHEKEYVRMLISDGQYFHSYEMLATQLNHLFHEGKLAEITIIRCNKYLNSPVNSEK